MAQAVSPWPVTAVHVGFVVDKVALGQSFLQVLSVPLSVSFCRHSITIYLGDEQ
jgi:hypothetical protein